MIAVAVVGMAYWGMRVRERTDRCRELAKFHDMAAQVELESADHPPAIFCANYRVSLTPEEKRRCEEAQSSWNTKHRGDCLRHAGYHTRAKQAFERTMWCVWEALPVIPEYPPET
jgi:hypothetical protein